jgi:hypothetical protein
LTAGFGGGVTSWDSWAGIRKDLGKCRAKPTPWLPHGAHQRKRQANGDGDDRFASSSLVGGALDCNITARGAFLTTAGAQTFPGKPVRIVVPFAAGTAPDLIARLLADRLIGAIEGV